MVAVDWQTYSTDALPGLATLTSTLNGMGTHQYTGDPATGTADHSTQRKNIASWTDSTYDSLVASVIGCSNKKERNAKLEDAEEYLVSKMPVCPLIFNESFIFKGSKISKFKFDGLGHFVFTNLKLSGYNKYYKPEDEQ